MKRHRLGAWIGKEKYKDKKTGRMRENSTWTVKYTSFDAQPGDYRSERERGFHKFVANSIQEADAIHRECEANGGRYRYRVVRF